MNSNNSDSSQGSDSSLGSGALGGFGYGIGLSVAVIVIFVIVTYASYMCRRASGGTTARNHRFPDDSLVVVIHEHMINGLDEATLSSYPKFTYSQLKPHKKREDSAASACSICLADYKDADLLRLLPDCGHVFHLKCVDPWLMLHPTCPICRSPPSQTPLSPAGPTPTLT